MSSNKNIITLVDDSKDKIVSVLPPHLDFDRFKILVAHAVRRNPKLLDCDQGSFMLALLMAAKVGLDPDGVMGHAEFIPRGREVQYQIGYKGYIALARQSGEVLSIPASAVHENDDIDLNLFGESRFSPLVTGDRGKRVGYIAVAKFRNGTYEYEFMTMKQILHARSLSPAWKQALKNTVRNEEGEITGFKTKNGYVIENVPWFHNFDQMAKKTVIKRLASAYLPLSVQQAVKLENLQEIGAKFDIVEGEVVERENTSRETTEVSDPENTINEMNEVHDRLDELEKKIED